MINQAQVIESLKREAATNPTSNAVLHVWALRERARNQVTIEGLHLKMREEKFSFEKKSYEPLLRLMAALGLGKLQVSSKGRIVALTDIRVTLQSIGKAAVGGEAILKKYITKRRFNVLAPSAMTPSIAKIPPIALHQSVPADPPMVVGLTVRMKTREVQLPLPSDMTDNEVATLVRWCRVGGRS